VIDVNITKQLISTACYDNQQVCAICTRSHDGPVNSGKMGGGKLGRSKVGLGKLGLGKPGFGKVGR